MPKQALITSKDPKGLHAVGLFEAAYNKAGLDENRAQCLNENGGEFQAAIREAIVRFSTPNQFADEEGESKYTYPPEYKGPKPIAGQITAIAEIFGLDPAKAFGYAKKLPQLPEGAEGWFAIPSLAAVAKKHFPEVADPAEQYCRAVQLIHAKIAAAREFHNYREGQITPAQLRLHVRTAEFLAQVSDMQPESDILIVAGQLGLRHRCKSVRRSREVFVANEYGFGSLINGAIVLTHPERLVRFEELDMDCAGDEFSLGADGSFDDAPCFLFVGGEVGFGTGVVSCFGGRFGSPSGFLPQ